MAFRSYILCLLLLPCLAFAEDARLFSPRPAESEVPVRSSATGVLRERLVEVDATALERLVPPTSVPAFLDLEFFDDTVLHARIERVEELQDGRSWVGRLEGDPLSSVVIVSSGGIVTGSVVSARDGVYRMGYDARGQHIQQLDPSAFSEKGSFVEAPPPATASDSFASDLVASDPETAADDGSTFELLVVYTSAARAAAGGTAGITALVNAAVTETNQALSNSSVIPRFHLAAVAEVSYTESDIGTDLTRLWHTADGHMDGVHSLRDAYAADLVVLVGEGYRDTGGGLACGRAYLNDGKDPAYASLAFSVVNRVCTTGVYTFAHGLGNNMGLNDARDDPSGTGSYLYSHGYKDPDGDFRTIMAQATPCPRTGGCPRILYFSNPNVSYNSKPTGIVETAPDSANNALSIDNTRSVVANWRSPRTLALSNGDGQSAVAGTAVGVPPAVVVRDGSGNPLKDATVVFEVVSGGGSVTGAAQTTNASGIATVGSWVLGATVGSNTLRATTAWVAGAEVTFTATGVAGPAASLAVHAGDGQGATVGTAVATAPAVLARDANGNAVPGFSVTFAVASGGGSVTGATQTTNASGVAAVGSWTLGTTTGSNTLTASAASLSNVTFTATGTAAAPATVAKQAGDLQTANVATYVATAPAVVVRDVYGNGVPGVTVTFEVASGGGTVTGATQTTNAPGVAAVGGWILGSAPGVNTLTACVGSLPAVTFSATATVGIAATMSAHSGDGQTAVVDTAVATAPAVVVRDASGNVVSGVSVTFAVASGGGSVGGATQTTDAAGLAVVGSWTLGSAPGVNTLQATSSSLPGITVTFSATGTPRGTLAIHAGDGQRTLVGGRVAVAPAVVVRDGSGNPMAGVTIVFTVSGGGGAVTGATQQTNAQGIAAVDSWWLGPTPGSNTLVATAAALAGAQVTFTATATEVPIQSVWHDWFAVDKLETPMVGDFDGDGRTDIITFTRQNPNAVGDVYVALSDGTKFGDNTKWHDWFAITTDETVVIGDYDGDGKDDIATWLGKTTRQVYVAKSYGTGMTPEAVWLASLGHDPTDVILSGDANGDGKDDLVDFARKQGKVYVALSTGTGFQPPVLWHSWFAVSTYERPRVADVNGDRKSDIVTFATDSPTAKGDVYVALSGGNGFGDNAKWHDWFAVQQTEQVRIADQNGDGRQDFFTFMPPPMAQCYTVKSLGASMADNVLWPEAVAAHSADTPDVGDANADGRADIIVFAQGEGKVYVSLGR